MASAVGGMSGQDGEEEEERKERTNRRDLYPCGSHGVELCGGGEVRVKRTEWVVDG